MPADELFKIIERRNEQDLYRMSLRMVTTTQAELMEQLEANRKALLRRQIALEVVWFFASVLIGFLLGYIFTETLLHAFPKYYDSLLVLVERNPVYVFYLLSAINFAGVYVTRITIWALKRL